MTDILANILQFISDPAVAVTVIAAGVIVYMQNRLYGKQHEFLRERLDVLRVDNEEFRRRNEELRIQLEAFHSETQRLRAAADMLAKLSRDLESTGELSEARYRDFVGTLREIAAIQNDGFSRLSEAVRESGLRPELLSIIDELASAVLSVESKRSTELAELQSRIRRLGSSAR